MYPVQLVISILCGIFSLLITALCFQEIESIHIVACLHYVKGDKNLDNHNYNTGKFARSWYYFALGISALVSFTCKSLFIAFNSIYECPFLDSICNDFLLYLQFIPVIGYLPLYSVLVLYLLYLSIAKAEEISVSQLLLFWNVSFVVIVITYGVALNYEAIVYKVILVNYVVFLLLWILAGTFIRRKFPDSLNMRTIPPLHRLLQQHFSTLFYFVLVMLLATSAVVLYLSLSTRLARISFVYFS